MMPAKGAAFCSLLACIWHHSYDALSEIYAGPPRVSHQNQQCSGCVLVLSGLWLLVFQTRLLTRLINNNRLSRPQKSTYMVWYYVYTNMYIKYQKRSDKLCKTWAKWGAFWLFINCVYISWFKHIFSKDLRRFF